MPLPLFREVERVGHEGAATSHGAREEPAADRLDDAALHALVLQCRCLPDRGGDLPGPGDHELDGHAAVQRDSARTRALATALHLVETVRYQSADDLLVQGA